MKIKILIVGFENDLASMLKLILEIEGYKVSLCLDGKKGLTMLSTDTLTDLILCDIVMPGMNGYAFVEAVRANVLYDKIPIIISSGMNLNHGRLPKNGCQGFLLKPFELEYFIEVIKLNLLITGKN